MTEFRLPRSGDVDLVFEGELLGEGTSAGKPGAQRWSEQRIYRTDSGKYVTEKVGRSEAPGEYDKFEVTVLERPEDVVPALRIKPRGADRAFLPNYALEALDHARQADPALERHAEERI